MGEITRLDRATIDRIAAGEVITRPARVVEELLDNAIDAGADRIEIHVDGDGTDRIRVVDDGSGMRREGARLAIERHTTSKLPADRPDDRLDRIDTLGFRGEALAAIADAGTLSIETSPDGRRGTELRVSDDDVAVRDVSRARGTTVEVTDLFASMPARSASMAAPETEFRRIADVVTSYALSHPGTRFSLTHDGQETFSTSGRGFTDALVGVYDRDVAAAATTFDHETTAERSGDRTDLAVSIDGVLTAPTHTRATDDHVRIAVRGRPVKHARLRRAVVDGYGSRLPADRYPIAVVRLSVPPAVVDPNVDPAKRTVGLVGGDRIADAIETAVDTALSTADERRAAEVTTSIDPDIDPRTERTPFETAQVIGSFRALYLLCEADGELLVVDQHAAHERINYERLRAAVEAEPIPSRSIDPPATVSLTPGGLAALEANRSTIETLGYGIEPFGGMSVRVSAVPEPFGRTVTPESIRDVLDELAAGTDPTIGREAILSELACHPSLKAGDRLSTAEARALLDRLGACTNPYACPHGRPTVLSIEETTLARGFDRQGVRFE